jgi:hypothetical protein
MYFFPTRTDVLDFSRSRVGPLLADNPFLLKQIADTDTVGLKQIGGAHLYFRGMQSKVGMKSVPADLIVFDELDEATPDARTLALERLAHSDYGRIIELSNPSLPGYGIDEQYERSDQRHWYLQCPSCDARTCLEREFPAQLRGKLTTFGLREDGTVYPTCLGCGGELDLDRGEWVADFPDRPIHGYRVSQLFSSKVELRPLLEDYLGTRHPERFFNLKIGIPWADLEKRVDVGAVMACVGDAEFGTRREHQYFVGVDTGKDLHVVILNRRSWDHKNLALVKLAILGSFQELSDLVKSLEPTMTIIDGLPETHATRQFAEKHPRTYMSFFSSTLRGRPRWDLRNRKVEVNRTEALDHSRRVIRDREIIVARNLAHLDEFARHMTCDAKKIEEDEETGERRARYIRTGANHFSMAFTYALLCMNRRRGDMVQSR